MDKIKRDSLDWRKICERFHDSLDSELMNMEEPSFFLFLFGHYNPTENEIAELNGYDRGLRTAKEILLRCIYEVIDEDQSVLTDEYLEQEASGEATIEEEDMFPPREWDEEEADK